MAETGTERVKSSLLDDLDDPRDTEITLGTGKLLGIFFALTILCAVFFTMGYLLGKSTANGSHTVIAGAPPSGGSSAGKPSAVNKPPEVPATAPSPDGTVQQSGASNSAATSVPGTQASPAAAATEIKSSPGGSYTVQVAAVTKQEDADILASALRKKQYPVFIASSVGDALFHVQVGPFTSQQDADTMKNRLSADGYNAIVKH
ncbi:MAG TPA: SPOR domain-containing protein [Verrucomicrobiae bacterium]|nr:SPOR domain-containing protein [Verrucomicrobiae bacterium]